MSAMQTVFSNSDFTEFLDLNICKSVTESKCNVGQVCIDTFAAYSGKPLQM